MYLEDKKSVGKNRTVPRVLVKSVFVIKRKEKKACKRVLFLLSNERCLNISTIFNYFCFLVKKIKQLASVEKIVEAKLKNNKELFQYS